MTVKVRTLAEPDRQAWEPLFRGYLEFYKSSLTDDMIDMTFQRLLGDDEQFHVGLVAVDDADVPVGLAHIFFIARPGRRRTTVILRICLSPQNGASKGLGVPSSRPLMSKLISATARGHIGQHRSSTIVAAPSMIKSPRRAHLFNIVASFFTRGYSALRAGLRVGGAFATGRVAPHGVFDLGRNTPKHDHL